VEYAKEVKEKAYDVVFLLNVLGEPGVDREKIAEKTLRSIKEKGLLVYSCLMTDYVKDLDGVLKQAAQRVGVQLEGQKPRLHGGGMFYSYLTIYKVTSKPGDIPQKDAPQHPAPVASPGQAGDTLPIQTAPGASAQRAIETTIRFDIREDPNIKLFAPLVLQNKEHIVAKVASIVEEMELKHESERQDVRVDCFDERTRLNFSLVLVVRFDAASEFTEFLIRIPEQDAGRIFYASAKRQQEIIAPRQCSCGNRPTRSCATSARRRRC